MIASLLPTCKYQLICPMYEVGCHPFCLLQPYFWLFSVRTNDPVTLTLWSSLGQWHWVLWWLSGSDLFIEWNSLCTELSKLCNAGPLFALRCFPQVNILLWTSLIRDLTAKLQRSAMLLRDTLSLRYEQRAIGFIFGLSLCGHFCA